MFGKKNSVLPVGVLLAVVGAIVYLPKVAQFGYFNDDWYLMYAARTYGVGVFRDIFSVDRPGRSFLMIPMYLLFGSNPLWYNLSAYVFRVIGALAFCWTLRKLWPKYPRSTTAMALFFLIYPGFLSQPNAIDYQSHIVGLALAWVSIGLSVYALAGRSWQRPILAVLAILTGWAYLSQMEYYIGFEIIRFLLFAGLVMQEQAGWRARLISVLKKWLVFATVPLGFGLWRLFFFHNTRSATDVGAHLSELLYSPIQTCVERLSWFFLSVLDVIMTAGGVPLYQLTRVVSPADVLTGLLLGILLTAAGLFAILHLEATPADESPGWALGVFRLGLGSVIAGLLPIIIAHRTIQFPDYSRYTLISAAGAAMMIVAGLYYLNNQRMRYILFAFLVVVGAVVHYPNSAVAAQDTASLRNFWWQVAWRIPQMERNTGMVHFETNSTLTK